MVVRMRATRSHRNNRRSHHALKGARISKCSQCGAEHLRHRACVQCGMYRGRSVIKAAKVAKPATAKKIAAPKPKKESKVAKKAPEKKVAKTKKTA